MAKMIPSTHTRSVFTGISGSSIFDTADRTSGYGESSSTSFVSNSVNSDDGRREGHTKYYPVLVEIWVIKLGALHVVKLRTCVALERFQVKKERFSSLNV